MQFYQWGISNGSQNIFTDSGSLGPIAIELVLTAPPIAVVLVPISTLSLPVVRFNLFFVIIPKNRKKIRGKTTSWV